MPPSRRKTSLVWKYFRVSEEDERKAICNNCGRVLNRGKERHNYSTSSLMAHVKRCSRPQSQKYDKSKTNVDVLLVDSGFQSQSQEDVGHADEEILDRKLQVPISPISNTAQLDTEEYVMPDPRCSSSKDVICSRQMDMIHSSLVMNTLYQQHRCGKLCDLTLISAPVEQPALVTQTETPSIVASKITERKKKVFQAHSSVLSGLSTKVKTLVEMGSRTIELKDVSPFGLKSLLEIVYTGKMNRTAPLRYFEIHQIWKAGSDLGIHYVQNYLKLHHPQATKWIQNEEQQAAGSSILESGGEEDVATQEEGSDLIDMYTGTTGEQQTQDDKEIDQEPSSLMHYAPPDSDEDEKIGKRASNMFQKTENMTWG